MKSHYAFALQVCLYLGFAASANAAAAAGGDVSSPMRSADEVSRKLDRTKVADDMAILERARAANENVYSALQSFVCKEEISRFRGDTRNQSAKVLDQVTAQLSFERGTENYTNVLQNKRPRAGISSLTGAWSEGEFGTLLLQTQRLLANRSVTFERYAQVRGDQASVYSFDVASNESPWDLAVGPSHYRLAFRTDVWIAVQTGEILRIDRTSEDMSAEIHISEIQWSITLDHVTLNGSNWLLPVDGTYSVKYDNTTRREWNRISFSDYRHYGAETALKFD